MENLIPFDDAKNEPKSSPELIPADTNVYWFAWKYWIHWGEIEGYPYGQQVEKGSVIEPITHRMMLIDEEGLAFFDDNIMNVADPRRADVVWPDFYI